MVSVGANSQRHAGARPGLSAAGNHRDGRSLSWSAQVRQKAWTRHRARENGGGGVKGHEKQTDVSEAQDNPQYYNSDTAKCG